jgi:hypothetical protein
MMGDLAKVSKLTAGYERSTAASLKMKEMCIESKFVVMPCNAVGQLPSPAASVCSHAGNAGTVCLDPSLQCLVRARSTVVRSILKRGDVVSW